MMTFKDTGCCGVQEICSLSTHTSAEDAMVGFCKSNIGTTPAYKGWAPTTAKGSLYSFYLFTAAVYPTYLSEPRFQVYQYQYGNRFAQFIVDNKLGEITTLPARVNAFHPDHDVQAWLWAPNVENITAWWKQWEKDHPTPKVPAPVPAPPMNDDYRKAPIIFPDPVVSGGERVDRDDRFRWEAVMGVIGWPCAGRNCPETHKRGNMCLGYSKHNHIVYYCQSCGKTIEETYKERYK